MGDVPRVAVRFDEASHGYYLNGVRVPSITQLLKADGLIDGAWFTPESRDRGTAVHALTAAYDLDALGAEYQGAYRPYLLAHIDAMRVLRPQILNIEEPWIHRGYRFGGRVDRCWKLYGALCVVDGKTGGALPWHPIQTALQALLASEEHGVPASLINRFGLYWKADGKWKLEPHENPADLGRAYSILATWAGKVTDWEPVPEW